MSVSVHEEIKKRSDEAINRGNHFPGYYGKSVEDFSREELEMLLNILHNLIVDAQAALQAFSKAISRE